MVRNAILKAIAHTSLILTIGLLPLLPLYFLGSLQIQQQQMKVI